MICYKDWLEKNIDSLEDEYNWYCTECYDEGDIPEDFSQYCEDAYEASISDYQDRIYDEWRDMRDE